MDTFFTVFQLFPMSYYYYLEYLGLLLIVILTFVELLPFLVKKKKLSSLKCKLFLLIQRLSWDKVEDPGYLRFRIGGLTQILIKNSGFLQHLFERAKVTEFLGSYTVWLRLSNLGSEDVPSLIGVRQEPATESIVPFFNQFDEWGYTMIGPSPHVSMSSLGSLRVDVEAMSHTWIFYKSNKSENLKSIYTSPGSVRKLKVPNPDY